MTNSHRPHSQFERNKEQAFSPIPSYITEFNQFKERFLNNNSPEIKSQSINSQSIKSPPLQEKSFQDLTTVYQIPQIDSIKKRSKPSVLRVNQLDALLLNNAIDLHLENYLQRIIPVSHWLHAIFKYSLRFFVKYMCLIRIPSKLQSKLGENSIHKPEVLEKKIPRMTLGDQMQNLCYKSTNRRMLFFIMASVVGDFFFPLINHYFTRFEWNELPEGIDIHDGDDTIDRVSMDDNLNCISRLLIKSKNYLNHTFNVWKNLYKNKAFKYLIWRIFFNLEKLMKIVSLLNFIIFLLNGRYRSLTDRICRMKLHYAHKLMYRQVSFDFMNRDLIWDGFAEFILFLLPILNLRWIVKKSQDIIGSISTIFQKKNLNTQEERKIESLEDLNSNCSFCNSKITTPYLIKPCKHVYCYYCLMKLVSQDSTTSCSLCGNKIKSWERLSFQSLGQSVRETIKE